MVGGEVERATGRGSAAVLRHQFAARAVDAVSGATRGCAPHTLPFCIILLLDLGDTAHLQFGQAIVSIILAGIGRQVRDTNS